MADIIAFVPKADLDAAANVRRFVAMCRDVLTVFGADLAFDDDAWDVAKALRQPGGAGGRKTSPWASGVRPRADRGRRRCRWRSPSKTSPRPTCATPTA